MYGTKILIIRGEDKADTVPVREERIEDKVAADELPFDPEDWEEELNERERDDEWAQFLGETYGVGYYRVFHPRNLDQMKHYFQGYVVEVGRPKSGLFGRRRE